MALGMVAVTSVEVALRTHQLADGVAYSAAMARQPKSRRGLPKLSAPGWRPLRGFLGPHRDDVIQSLSALAFSAVTSVVAGLTLASRQDQFTSLPGLLLFVPAAIALRGNVFGPFGSRLSTALQTGTFAWSIKPDSVLGQNVIAALVNSLAAGLALAAVAEVFALTVRSDGATPLGVSDFVVVSVAGGLLASIVVLLTSLGLAVMSVRFDWDLDNVTAPLVTAAGDLITLPALVVSIALVRKGDLTVITAAISVVVTLVSLLLLTRSSLDSAKRIVIESLPVLIGAGILSLIAGVAIEGSLSRLSWVLLVLLPGYLGTAGALGGILANRLSTKVHLGLIDRTWIPRGTARTDMGITAVLAFPIFVFLVVVAEATAGLAGQSTLNFGLLLGAVLTGGLIVTLLVLAVAYYGTLAVVRFGLDPDNLGIPIVTATLDVVGALSLTFAVVLWGLG